LIPFLDDRKGRPFNQQKSFNTQFRICASNGRASHEPNPISALSSAENTKNIGRDS
jgi:hypothetical protein